MVSVIFLAYHIFAFLGLVAGSPHVRRYNDGQLTWPPDGYSIQASSTLTNITYHVYDSL
jgi:hypothetical protein